MTKIQKVWLGIFLAMFIVPEVLFSFLVSTIFSLLGRKFYFIYQLFIKEQFFTDNPAYLFISICIEIIGLLGLLMFNIKYNKSKAKQIYSILLVFVLICLCVIFYIGYSISNISFP